MRDLGIGCIGMLFGAFIGAALAFFATTFVSGGLRPVPDPVSAPNAVDVTITANGRYVSTQVQQALAANGIAKQSTVSLVPPNRMQVSATTNVSFLGQSISVDTATTLSAAVQNGRVVVKVEKVDAGGISLPADLVGPMVERLRSQGETVLNRIIQQNLQGTGLKLTNIRVTSDAVAIDLSSR